MKKNNSYEILLVVVLLLALGSYAAIHYLINPLKERNEAAEQQIAIDENTLREKFLRTISYGTQTERLNTVKSALDNWNGYYYSNVNEEYLIDHIRKNLADNKLSLISLSVKTGAVNFPALLTTLNNPSAAYNSAFPEEKGEAEMGYDSFKKAFDKMKDEKQSRLNSEVKTTTMNLSASGSYTNMLHFLTSVKETGNTIIIESISVEMPANVMIPKNEDASKANPSCTFTVTLSFVDVPAANTYAEKYTAEPLVPYVFPPMISNGTYRTTPSGLAGLLGNLFK